MNTKFLPGTFFSILALIASFAQPRTANAKQPVDPDTLSNCTWSAAPVYPITILDNAVTSVGSNLYSFGGASTNIIGNAYKFDGNTWTSIRPLPVAVEFPAAVNDGTNIYILGGANSAGTPTTTLTKYDPVANFYTSLAPFTTGTWNHAAVYLNGKIYKFCGTTGPVISSTNVLEIYDVASNTWSPGAVYPLSESFVGAWAQGGFIYAAGGINIAATAATAKTYRYDPVANTWDDAAIADLPATRYAAAAAFYLSDGVLAGGFVAGTATANISNTAISWDQPSNTWGNLPNMLGERSRMTGAVLSTSFYAVGGRSMASNLFVGTNDNQKLLCFNTPTNILTNGGFSIVSAGANGVIDPGETVTVSLRVQNSGGPGVVCTTAATAGMLQPTGGVTSPSGPQNYGAICSGSPAVFRNFTFTVDPSVACGGTVTASLVMTDGATNYGTIAYTFVTGVLTVSSSENFDGVTAPALPAGWTTMFSGTGTAVRTSTTFPNTSPNDIFLSEATQVGLSEVASATYVVPVGAPSRLTFRNLFNTEFSEDGLVLEISIAGGPFQDILAAGGSFVSGGYNSTLSTGFGNPLPGRMAWSGLSGGTASAPAYITTVVNLPPSAVNQNIQLKWRQGSDNTIAPTTNPGSRIDTITLTSFVCNGSGPGSITVISNADAGGSCPGASCTLRQAIATATSGDTINFAAGIRTIDLTSGELLINKHLIINGPGANLLSVQRSAAAGNFRIFNVSGSSSVEVAISGLTIANGQLSGSSFPGSSGGGILNEVSTLTLSNCALSGNNAALGGAILNLRGNLTLTSCTLDQNSVTGSGGAILNAGYNDTGVATLTLTNCTLNQNQAGQYGGAIYSDGTSSGNAQLTLTNCTLNQNTAALGASGIYNDALNPGSSGVANLSLRNTILRAGASGANLVNDNGAIYSGGHNLSSDAAGGPAGTGPGGFLNNTGDIRNTDPQLDPAGLANNGGSTMTIALQATSPAINGGDDQLSPLTDQRGYLRNGVSDIGSFEFGGTLPPTLIPVCVSRKLHGSFVGDIPLPRSGALGVECRTGGASGIHQVIMTFPGTVTVTDASVTTGVGSVSSFSVSGPEVTVNLTGISNAQKIVIRLFGVSNGVYTNDVDLPMGVLLGDTTGNGNVSASDVSLTKLKSGQALDSSNFRNDVNVNGSINASDVSSVKLKTGTALP